MGSYTLSFKNSVEKDCRKIPKELLPGIFERVETLAENPFPHDTRKIAAAPYRCTGSGLGKICRLCEIDEWNWVVIDYKSKASCDYATVEEEYDFSSSIYVEAGWQFLRKSIKGRVYFIAVREYL